MLVKERPILFSADMVRAVLAGKKTQTRRLVKSPHVEDADVWAYDEARGLWESGIYGEGGVSAHGEHVRCPFGSPGDRLWVREAWQAIHVSIDPETGHGDEVQAAPSIPKDSRDGWWSAVHAATDPQASEHRDDRGFAWRPGIHMPRWASRITLEVTEVRVERLRDISEEDARAEGAMAYVTGHGPVTESELQAEPGYRHPRMYRLGFEVLWRQINGDDSWDASPWVWVVSFRRVEQEARAA